MRAHCSIDAYRGQGGGALKSSFLGLQRQLPCCLTIPASSVAFPSGGKGFLVSCRAGGGRKGGEGRKGERARGKNGGGLQGAKGKENVWSIDNDLAAKAADAERRQEEPRSRRRTRTLKGPRRKAGSRVLVSAAMLMEVETVLQTQEPVIIPVWPTFASSLSGIWKGVGAVFSPITAEMEPIGISNKSENLYDCYVLSRVEEVPSGGQASEIRRKTNWVTLNPLGEREKHFRRSEKSKEREESSHVLHSSPDLPSIESFDLGRSEVMEEDHLGKEPGLVFFEDGSYSRGPVEIPVGDYDESKYFLSPTFKFEQCLVKGCHKRLRIVHTIEFSRGGTDVQIIRVAVFEEEWISPVNFPDESGPPLDLKPFSQRRRTQPSDLAGAWKVFEISSTPIFSEEQEDNGGGAPPHVFLCMETLKKRGLPDSPVYFGEEEVVDLQDVTVLWLPGGVTGYVDVRPDGVLCIGVGWYSDEGVNLVMERDYATDGKLREVRWKTEVKRRWAPSTRTPVSLSADHI
ncbi:unnamed protein product [Spirodela intermedia]|uniref:Uncharacterized protein n=1 Tax=Spirodela intermedia TaxID=51605 RepID=A0A7I8LBW5_SPIIN|nr:unnamed protein product [Spirodela intermedia]